MRHTSGGTTNPTGLPLGRSLSRTTVLVDNAILVFRESLETILLLAAVLASFLGTVKLPRLTGPCARHRELLLD